VSRLARERGRLYEIEVGKFFSKAFGREFKRKLGQARDSGNDMDVGPFVVECKRTRRLGFISTWMEQAKAACAARSQPHTMPIVVCREDENTSFVIMHLCDFCELAHDRVAVWYDGRTRSDA
jgi:hypothetical protein